MIDDTIFSIFWESSANFNRTERIDKCFYVRSQQQTWFSRKDNFDSRTKRDWENGFALRTCRKGKGQRFRCSLTNNRLRKHAGTNR